MSDVRWKSMNSVRGALILVAAFGLIAACGGNRNDGGGPYAAKCATPRSGNDPVTGRPFPDVRGSILDEKKWAQSWSQDLYLWYRELPDIAPSDSRYPTPIDYFKVLKTSALTPSGSLKDRFHFTVSTETWVALSQSGVEAGYGAQWVAISKTPPRQVLVAFTEPGSPADAQGLRRGAEVVKIDGVAVVDGSDVNTLNRGLSPSAPNETHTFEIRDRGATVTRTITLISANVTISSVQNIKTLPPPNAQVGYMLFNQHIATSEAALIAAVNQLKNAGISDLVIDIRYNGGGYLDIANELAYMIAGPATTSGKTFEKAVFNDKYPDRDPVTGRPVASAFLTTTRGFSTTAGQPLPNLGLPRVFLLTGSGTCSASESIINGLRGVDVQVIQIGATTCGKPFGFYPKDNCGTTYFTIQLQTVNNKGFGEYPDGFTPASSDPAGLPGCRVDADDFSHDLGDVSETRLSAALRYRSNQTCSGATPIQVEGSTPLATEGQLLRSPWREIRTYSE